MLSDEQQRAYEDALRKASLDAEQYRLQAVQMQNDLASEDKSMIHEQLDLSQEKRELYYQLKGYVLKHNVETNELEWTQDPNNDLSFLTEAGINYCFWFLLGYLNKNILLGNYEDDTIMAKLEDIGVTLSDTLFTKSNKYFKEPTIAECKEEIMLRIKKKTDLRKFAKELVGLEVDEEQIKKEIIHEMEHTIEEELEKIKSRLMNEKYKMMNSLIVWMLDQIHGAYQRAWKGQERKSLREHMHISENKGSPMMIPQKESFLDRFRRGR